ncbi:MULTISPECIES: fimbrial protein [Enterobacter]|uniref:fimbrial protein n=1 Tax=Enterobacter TaxID=547 RepID=UPI001F2CACB5|nr:MULTISPECIES: fimbrial protein [Enterobacter]WKW90237.1 Major fimbrial subunit SMF-1 [Enterobacter sichuanensis]
MYQRALLATLTALSISVLPVNAASTGTVNFKGRVTASTCDVSVDGQGVDATVKLPTVPSTDLASAGQTAGRTTFIMTLTNCTQTYFPPASDDDEASLSDSMVSAFFQAGETVDSSTGRLKQMALSGAENVSLQLRDGTNNNVIFAGSQTQRNNNYFVDITGKKGEEIRLPYVVEYYAESAATSGVVTSSVVYNLQYQ